MRVLVACEYSGRVRDALIARGHDAVSCDILPSDAAGPHIQGDVLPLLGDGWDMLIAFPPCTHLASSGARYFAEKRSDGRQQQGIDFFMALANAPIPQKCIENPVGIMSNVYRKPDQIIQPWQFGHPETKMTCLWLTALPPLTATDVCEPQYHTRPDGTVYKDKKGKRYNARHFTSGRRKDRAEIRSLTYRGIANAMADQWS